MARRKQKCALCTEADATTRDHIPGKQFFPGTPPVDLITVPCCQTCNGRLKPHEDYVRMLFSVGPASETEHGFAVWRNTTQPGLDKDKGLTRVLAKNIEPVDLKTPAGIYLGTKPGIRVNWDRVFLVIEKCVRGLYYYETGEILHKDAEIVRGGIFEHNQDYLSSVLAQTNPGKWKAPNVFQYKWNRYPDTPKGTLWAMMFYNTHSFVAITDATGIVHTTS